MRGEMREVKCKGREKERGRRNERRRQREEGRRGRGIAQMVLIQIEGKENEVI